MISEDGLTWRVNEERGALLVNPGRPILPETAAVHHIFNAKAAPLPFLKRQCTWPYCAQPGHVGSTSCVLRRAFLHPEIGRPSALDLHLEMRTSSMTGTTKVLHQIRYQRVPDGPAHNAGLQAHLAMPDAYVTTPPLALPSELRVA